MNVFARTPCRFPLGIAFALALGAALFIDSDAGARDGRSGWYAAWGTSQQGLDAAVVSNSTVRMITRPTLSGSHVRVQLQNTFGTTPLVIGAAKIGVRNNAAQLVPGSNTALTFGGSPTVTIPAGSAAYSDPVAFDVHAWQDIAISLYLPDPVVQVSRHNNARATSYFTAPAAGDHTSDEGAAAFVSTTTSMWWLAAIDVYSPSADGSIVFFGDSITDGTATTTDGHDRWHDIIALRFMLDSREDEEKARLGVVNEGIGGNEVVGPPDYAAKPTPGGPSALERLQRDVISLPGVSIVIWLEGINDFGARLASAQAVSDGVREGVKRLREGIPGVRIYMATLTGALNSTPTHGTPEVEAKRQAYNSFIRTAGIFDGVIDFDVITLDPPPRLVVQRMRDVPERSVLALLARHRNEKPVGPLNDLDVANHEAVVEDDGNERLELFFFDREDPDLRDIHR
jgi:lysophospholipase L1-like esterase